jgi:hypothetical protein
VSELSFSTNRPLIIRALHSHALECIDRALHARAKGDLDEAGKMADESNEAHDLADELETGRPGIDSNGRFATAKAVA